MNRHITDQNEINEITAIRFGDVTRTKIYNLIADTNSADAKFQIHDTFYLKENVYNNKVKILTTVGRFIFNVIAVTPEIHKHIGYWNDVISGKNIGAFESKITDLVFNDTLTTQDYFEYLDRMQWMTGILSFISPSLSMRISKPLPSVMKMKKELFDKYSDELNSSNSQTRVTAGAKIETTLLAFAEEEMKRLGWPEYDYFKAGVSKSFKNVYKNISIMRGPIQDFSTKEYYVSDKNLMEGIPKEELWMYSNLSVTGSYGRGVQTRDGGYDTKKMLSAMQSVVLDEDGSDCGSGTYITKTITENNKKDNIYRWIMEDMGLVQLTSSNISQYISKPVNMRSPMACIGEKICSKCAGGLYYIMDIKNVGLMTTAFSGSLMYKAMRTFHDTTINVGEVEINKFITQKAK